MPEKKNEKKEIVDLGFKVEKDFKKDFKQLALDKDMSLVQLFKECFEFYKNSKEK